MKLLRSAIFAIAIPAVLAMLTGAYAAAYHQRSLGIGLHVINKTGGISHSHRVRYFPSDFEATFFKPAARVESILSGDPIVAVSNPF